MFSSRRLTLAAFSTRTSMRLRGHGQKSSRRAGNFSLRLTGQDGAKILRAPAVNFQSAAKFSKASQMRPTRGTQEAAEKIMKENFSSKFFSFPLYDEGSKI